MRGWVLGEDGALGQVQQVHIACLVARQQVVMGLMGPAEAADALHLDEPLADVLLDRALVVAVLLLLLDLVHTQVQIVDDRLLQHIVDHRVRER